MTYRKHRNDGDRVRRYHCPAHHEYRSGRRTAATRGRTTRPTPTGWSYPESIVPSVTLSSSVSSSTPDIALTEPG
jgi:hypothetical protein